MARYYRPRSRSVPRPARVQQPSRPSHTVTSGMQNGHILVTAGSLLLHDVIMTKGARPSRWAHGALVGCLHGGIAMTSLGKSVISARARTALGAHKSVSVLVVTAVAAGLTAVAGAGPAGAAATHAGRHHHAAPVA